MWGEERGEMSVKAGYYNGRAIVGSEVYLKLKTDNWRLH
jgi:hypothetical protein